MKISQQRYRGRVSGVDMTRAVGSEAADRGELNPSFISSFISSFKNTLEHKVIYNLRNRKYSKKKAMGKILCI